MMTDGVMESRHNKNKQIKTKEKSEVVGSASAVHSAKRTVEVILVRLAEAEEEGSGSGLSEVTSEDVRGVPLQ
jgi:serine phosphatase RsbU (regulator of sigma subunit)